MSTTINATLESIRNWPTTDQIDLFHSLWEQINHDFTPELSVEQKQELDRRLADHEAHPEKTLTWEQVAERLRFSS